MGTNSSVILTIDISPLLEMNNINYDDGMSSIVKGHMGATGEDFNEQDNEDDMSGSEYGNSPNQSPNPKDTIDPLNKKLTVAEQLKAVQDEQARLMK